MEKSETRAAQEGSKETNLALLEQRQVNSWQKKLLPWLVAMPTLLILLFVYLATVQMQKFNAIIDQKTESVIEPLEPNPADSVLYKQLSGNMDYIRWMSLARMEEKSLDRRYSQGGLLLVSRIFTKYLGFFTGMILAMVGSIFIIGKLQEKTTEIEGEVGNGIKGKLASSSPGIIFGVLGTVLMLSTILQHSEIAVTDKPLFLNSPNIYLNAAAGNPATPANSADDVDSSAIEELEF